MKTNIYDGRIPCTLELAQAVKVTHRKDFVFHQERGRDYYAFIHVLQGQLEYTFLQSGQTLLAGAGETAYIPKGCRYCSRYLLDETQVAVLQFDIRQEETGALYEEPMQMPPEATQMFRGSMERFERMDSFGCAARIYDLLGLLHRQMHLLSPRYQRLAPALARIEEDLTENLPVADYAALCRMSVPGFRRAFRECFGLSPVEYRNGLRLMNARKLIMSGEYSVEQAAALSGFTNLSFFYRLFRRAYGVTPGKLL